MSKSEFKYEAFDNAGRLQTGTVPARTTQDALQAVHGFGLTPVRVRKLAGKHEKQGLFRLSRTTGARHFQIERLAEFFRLMSILLDSGINVDEAMETLRYEHMFNREFGRHISEIHQDVIHGASFSEALSKKPEFLPTYYVSMIEAGEESGTLKAVLRRISEHMERVFKRKKSIRAALVYPVILLLSAVAAMSIITLYLVPVIEELTAESRRSPPLVFSSLIALRAFLADYLPVVLLAGLILLLLLYRWWSSQTGGRLLYGFGMRMPFLGIWLRKAEMVQFASLLGLLLESGIPILRALDMTRGALRSPQFRAAAVEVRKAVAGGGGLMDAESFKKLAPNPTQKMIEVGERTSRITELLQSLARLFDEDLQRFVSSSITLITPVLTLVIGGGIGTIIFMIMSAILDLNTLAGP